MSDTEIFSLCYDLKDKIIDSDLYKNLKKREKEMLNNEECFLLLNEFEKAKEDYKNAKRFENYGSDVLSAQTRLSEIKYKVDENPFVKEYNKAYKKMKKELNNIQNIIFKDIVKERKEISIEE